MTPEQETADDEPSTVDTDADGRPQLWQRKLDEAQEALEAKQEELDKAEVQRNIAQGEMNQVVNAAQANIDEVDKDREKVKEELEGDDLDDDLEAALEDELDRLDTKKVELEKEKEGIVDKHSTKVRKRQNRVDELREEVVDLEGDVRHAERMLRLLSD